MAANEKYLTYSDAAEIVDVLEPLGINQYIGYNPAGTYDTYLSVLNSDGTYAPTGMTTEMNDLYVKFSSRAVQVQNSQNDWYPTTIAGRQYANMTTNNVLPLYYSQYVLTNPGAGKIKAKDFILVINGAEYSLASVINNL